MSEQDQGLHKVGRFVNRASPRVMPALRREADGAVAQASDGKFGDLSPAGAFDHGSTRGS